MASVSPQSPKSPVSESFAALFEESLNRKEMRVGEVITAEVVSVDENFVVVNAGLKSESVIDAAAIEETVVQTGDRRVVRLPLHINDPAFAAAAVEAFHAISGE